MEKPQSSPAFDTLAVHAGPGPEPANGAVNPAIQLSSTFAQDEPGKHRGYEYSRTGNPTRAALEMALAQLENGAWGLTFASGSAASNTLLNLLQAGDHVVAGNDLYGGSYRLFTKVWEKQGLAFTFADPRDPAATAAAMRPQTRLVWLESPSNPLLRITDIAATAALARRAGALTVVDNTFASPALQKPLELGADLVVHSTTKYLGGHSDVVGGAIVGRDPELQRRLAFFQNAVGAVPGPFDCFLVLRGVRTLSLRMKQHCLAAGRIAAFLRGHPKVHRVHYPGLPDHPGHALAKAQMSGFGGMISLELAADLEAAKRFVSTRRWFTLAESLGGVESLIEHPATMTHASIPPAQRAAIGLPDGLIRLSVGIEDPDDLIADLAEGLKALA